MVELAEQLSNLAAQVCRYPPGSLQRQKLLTEIIRLTANKLWRENTPYYQDALQQTWLYFCRNICEGLTAQAYNPAYGSVITWLNAYLKRRLQDLYIEQQQAQATTVSFRLLQDGQNNVPNPIENIASVPQTRSILEEIETWLKTDSTGELRRICVKGHPEVNCQVLILKRLPPEVSWKELSQEFGIPIPTLSSFYQRQCLPRLRKFAESEGYL
jgi:hypothetical protein